MLQSTSYVEGDLIHGSSSHGARCFFEGKSRRSDNPLSASQPDAEKKAPSKPVGHDLKKQKEKAEGVFVRDLTEPD